MTHPNPSRDPIDTYTGAEGGLEHGVIARRKSRRGARPTRSAPSRLDEVSFPKNTTDEPEAKAS